MTEKTTPIEELRWVRLFSPFPIPKYLVEQVRDREYSVDDFFKFNEINCLIQKNNTPTLNPFHHLYGLINKENQTKGFLWFIIDPLSKDLIINTYSVDKEYWGKGEAVKKLIFHIKEIMEKLKIKKTFWMTNYPKHSMRYGFKRSKSVLMEYTLGEENGTSILGGDNSRVECKHVDPGATATVQPGHATSRA